MFFYDLLFLHVHLKNINHRYSYFRAIHWDKVDIEVMSIETDLAGYFQKGTLKSPHIQML